MPDLLVRLYALPQMVSCCGIDWQIRRAHVPESHFVEKWVSNQFGAVWASECRKAFCQHPVSCFIALSKRELIGFACYDATFKGFFGPQGISGGYRGQGIGKVLLQRTMHAMADQGYAYAIVGGAGPVDFYKKSVNAQVIEHSDPGPYDGMILK